MCFLGRLQEDLVVVHWVDGHTSCMKNSEDFGILNLCSQNHLFHVSTTVRRCL